MFILFFINGEYLMRWYSLCVNIRLSVMLFAVIMDVMILFYLGSYLSDLSKQGGVREMVLSVDCSFRYGSFSSVTTL